MKKRLRKEISKIGQNICQRILCGLFSRDGYGGNQKNGTDIEGADQTHLQISNNILDESHFVDPNGLWEAGPHQLPHQP